MYCYLEFKLRYLKNLKLFLIRVKELFEPIVLRKKGDGFCPSNARGFYGKRRKFRKGNLYLTENRLSRNEIWYAEDDHSYMCHICAKGVLD